MDIPKASTQQVPVHFVQLGGGGDQPSLQFHDRRHQLGYLFLVDLQDLRPYQSKELSVGGEVAEHRPAADTGVGATMRSSPTLLSSA